MDNEAFQEKQKEKKVEEPRENKKGRMVKHRKHWLRKMYNTTLKNARVSMTKLPQVSI